MEIERLYFGDSKMTADGDCSHEIKMLAPWKKSYGQPSILKSRAITLPINIRLVKAMVFPVIMYGCESWTIKKAERQRIDALNYGVGEDFGESLGLQGDQAS